MQDSQELKAAQKEWKKEEMRQVASKIELAEAERIALGWRSIFDKRQRRLIDNCCVYADNDPAGIPGHQLMLIIAEMTSLLDGNL